MRRVILSCLAALAMVLGLSAPSASALTYGWHWGEVVDVYDGTPAGANWKVSEAVREWDGASKGLVMRMVSDPAAANIVVTQVDAMVNCSSGAIGCATGPTVSNGVASGVCYVDLRSFLSTWGVAEEVSLHEIGHCLGLDHAPDGTASVMLAGTNANDYYTKPQPYDRRDIRALYG